MKDAYFVKGMQFVFEWEGGYVNNPNDPGGATNYGITQNTLNDWVKEKGLPALDVKDMSKLMALDIYEANYWKSDWKVLGWELAMCMLDTSINMGTGRAYGFLKNCGNNYVTFLQLRNAKYKELVEKNPKLSVFLKGWGNRMTALRRFIDENRDISV